MGKRKGKFTLLNVREYIEWVIHVTEGYENYGECPLIDEEMAKIRVIGKAIIRKHDALRAKGNRKDIYVPAGDGA